MKILSKAQIGVDFGHLGAQVGKILRVYLKKMSKLSYILN